MEICARKDIQDVSLHCTCTQEQRNKKRTGQQDPLYGGLASCALRQSDSSSSSSKKAVSQKQVKERMRWPRDKASEACSQKPLNVRKALLLSDAS